MARVRAVWGGVGAAAGCVRGDDIAAFVGVRRRSRLSLACLVAGSEG